MQNLAALGVSSQAISSLTQDDISDYDLNSEIPYVKEWRNVEKQTGEAPVREPVYDTIDREEWERRETALDVRETVQNALDHYFPDQPVYPNVC